VSTGQHNPTCVFGVGQVDRDWPSVEGSRGKSSVKGTGREEVTHLAKKK